MDKYEGINKAEVVVSKNESPIRKGGRKRKTRRRGRIGFAVRVVVAAAIAGGLFGLRALKMPKVDAVLDAVVEAVSFDVFGEGGGEIRAVTLISGLVDGEKEEDETDRSV